MTSLVSRGGLLTLLTGLALLVPVPFGQAAPPPMAVRGGLPRMPAATPFAHARPAVPVQSMTPFRVPPTTPISRVKAPTRGSKNCRIMTVLVSGEYRAGERIFQAGPRSRRGRGPAGGKATVVPSRRRRNSGRQRAAAAAETHRSGTSLTRRAKTDPPGE